MAGRIAMSLNKKIVPDSAVFLFTPWIHLEEYVDWKLIKAYIDHYLLGQK